jgi:D-alanyl-D-alanine carboxypeptidase
MAARAGKKCIMRLFFYITFLLLCINGYAQKRLNYFDSFITDTVFRSAHMGVSVYDPLSETYLHSYQSDKYFVPASNTKIFTCYAALKYLPDSLSVQVNDTWWREMGPGWAWSDNGEIENYFPVVPLLDSGAVWSGSLDSLLRPMMYRSDNFLAEQFLRTVLKDGIIIDTIVKNVFRGDAQLPRWVDGCGLSRYNLFTPLQFVFVLDKMQKEFGIKRIRHIFPSGNNGTLKNYYVSENGSIFAKTGSLTGVIALSGYIYTTKNKLLIFSVLINNYNGPGSVARRRIERFIKEMRSVIP